MGPGGVGHPMVGGLEQMEGVNHMQVDPSYYQRTFSGSFATTTAPDGMVGNGMLGPVSGVMSMSKSMSNENIQKGLQQIIDGSFPLEQGQGAPYGERSISRRLTRSTSIPQDQRNNGSAAGHHHAVGNMVSRCRLTSG